VIATGTQFRGEDWLDQIKNARQLATAGRVHLGPAAVGERDADLGTHVAVIGGGDNAFDVSRMLAEKGVHVSLVLRSKSPAGQPLLVERLRPHQASGMAELMVGRTVTALEQAGSRIRMRLNDGGEITVDHVVLLFGYRPEHERTLDRGGSRWRRTRAAISWSTATCKRPVAAVFAVGDRRQSRAIRALPPRSGAARWRRGASSNCWRGSTCRARKLD